MVLSIVSNYHYLKNLKKEKKFGFLLKLKEALQLAKVISCFTEMIKSTNILTKYFVPLISNVNPTMFPINLFLRATVGTKQ
jgi:hypothetical protein